MQLLRQNPCPGLKKNNSLPLTIPLELYGNGDNQGLCSLDVNAFF